VCGWVGGGGLSGWVQIVGGGVNVGSND